MKRLVFAALMIVLIIYIAVSRPINNGSALDVFNTEKKKVSSCWHKERELFKFVESHVVGHEKDRLTDLMSKEGTYTLSESVGLMMRYCVLRGRIDSFHKEFEFLQKKLMLNNKYIKWKAGSSEIHCNAAIDDLRIIRALLDAYEKWGKKEYFNTAGFIQEGIYSSQVIDGNLYEFYDWKSDTAKASIPLCYLDLYTLDRLRIFNNSWLNVADRGLSIIKGGRFDENSPFFYKYFNYETGRYYPDEELEKQGGICLTYTLYTVIHLSEVNENTEFFTDWLKREIEKGRLYAWYNPKTLKPSKKMESTAVYALAAIYCKKVGEEEMYFKLVDRMLDFMIDNKNSPYYGGFGNEKTGEFYSFDNLTALLALGMAEGSK